jgi:signal transduction histidine kinase
MRGLHGAIAVAALLTAAAAAGRLLDRGLAGFPDLQLGPGQTPNSWLPALIAAGALCVAALARRSAPWLGWFAAGYGAAVAGIEIIALVRARLVSAAAGAYPELVAVDVLAALAAGAVCTGLAWASAASISQRRGARPVRLAIGAGLVAIAAAEGWALLASADLPEGPLDGSVIWPVRAATRVLLVVLGAQLLAASFLVAGPRVRRAWSRTRGGGTSHGPANRQRLAFATALADEFVPGMTDRGRRAAEAERARLAADLHARIVPELRRAVASGGSSTADLRSTLDDLESIMAERHSVILERFGLVAALEWLAERTEARSATRVELNLPGSRGAGPDDAGPDDAGPDDADPPPRDVERAAFRVALLAVENAVRHAPGAPIEIRLAASPAELTLEIRDGGPGIDEADAERARRSGRRGLADMEAAAAAVGATTRLSRLAGDEGPGTRVLFTWPAG